MANKLSTLRTLARVFDDLIPIPGTRARFGLDALIGLLPGGGDLVGGAVSVYGIVVAARMGAPASVIARMGLNILIDTIVGSVPLIGDVFDIGWKANRRNLELLERYEASPARVKRASTAVIVGVILGVIAIILAVAVLTVWLIVRLV